MAKKANKKAAGKRAANKGKAGAGNPRKLPCDIAGLMLIGLGLFAALSMFTPFITGVVGAAVKAFLQGLFGLAAWAMPVLLLVGGWLTLIAYDKRINGGKLALTLSLFVFLSLFLHLFWHGTVQALAEKEGYAPYLAAAYAYGRDTGLGLGLIAGLWCYPVQLLLGTAGGFVLAVLGLLGCVAGLTHLSLTQVGRQVSQSVGRTTQRAAQSVRARREESRQRREEDRLRRQEADPADDWDLPREDRAAYREAPAYERGYDYDYTEGDYAPAESERGAEAETEARPFPNELVEERRRDGHMTEAAFTPLRPRWEEESAEEIETEPVDPRPPLFPPELALDTPPRPLTVERVPLDETPGTDENEPERGSYVEPEYGEELPPWEEEDVLPAPKVVPARTREERPAPIKPAHRPAPVPVEEKKNPSVADFDDEEDDEFLKGPVQVTAVPKQELDYLYGEEAEMEPKKKAPQAEPYRFPPLSILATGKSSQVDAQKEAQVQQENVRRLEETLGSFGIEARVLHVSRGPAITRYELQPARGVKVSRITGLADDIALNMAAVGVRIEAPIPGKAAVGIEIANQTIDTVALREVLESKEFREHPSKLAVALGKDIAGDPMVADLARMPHLLIAGATGSGKSVCINSLIASILYKATPEEVKLILVDPKVVELSVYNGVPHLLIPVVTDPKKAAGALGWAVREMDERYRAFAGSGCRDLKGYNAYLTEKGEKPLPQIVVIIDELADLMMVAPGDVEERICRLAQLARAAGIHLVIATQRPSVNVITGVIKANIPSRIAFAVASQVDSRTILDMAGAEKLLGRGDMLFDPSGANKKLRVQGAFISDKEVNDLVDYVRQHSEAVYDEGFLEAMEHSEEDEAESEEAEEGDELLAQAVELAVDSGQISASMLQRRFRVGYARAGRLLDEMEKRKLISGFEGSKPRQVLISRDEYERIFGRG